MAEDELLIDRLLRKAERRAKASDEHGFERKAQIVLDQLMPMQRELALDDHKRIGLLTPGRNGKTFAVRGRLFRGALTTKDYFGLYIGLTRIKAEQEMWNGSSGIINICEKLGLRDPVVKFDRQKLIFTIPSINSTLLLGGADDMKAIELYRGGPGYNEVWIDEAKSHPRDLLKELINEILIPRINARFGVLGLCGTPGSILDSLFYDITRVGSDLSVPYGQPNPIEDFKWSMHRWNLAMNTSPVPNTHLSLWELALLEKKSKNWTDQTPTWMREYLGLWAAEDTDFVYRFRPYADDGAEFNIWKPQATDENPFGLPTVAHLDSGSARLKWNFAIGIDLGSVDPCAIEVFAFAEQTRQIFHVHEWYRQTLDVDVLANALDAAVKLIQKYADYPVSIVGDTAHMGATILEQVRAKTGHRVEPAVKADKMGFVALTNDDLVDGRLKILKGSELASQMAQLQWDERGKRENKAQRNDACDASIYARGAITRYINHSKPLADPVQTPEQELLHGLFKNGSGVSEPRSAPGHSNYRPGSAYQPTRGGH